ncbi:hypothetical protein GCM10017774_42560 [Lentzea cavernae]|uniref:Uncharacterized protein n=1 Tax=Lentzea cavernae TaxID=2020703 RepID=A0ABQ3MFH9_9PSEU|nr:hypothetical protein GCM10017774_42560 [Lentzea cavernae]
MREAAEFALETADPSSLPQIVTAIALWFAAHLVGKQALRKLQQQKKIDEVHDETKREEVVGDDQTQAQVHSCSVDQCERGACDHE